MLDIILMTLGVMFGAGSLLVGLISLMLGLGDFTASCFVVTAIAVCMFCLGLHLKKCDMERIQYEIEKERLEEERRKQLAVLNAAKATTPRPKPAPSRVPAVQLVDVDEDVESIELVSIDKGWKDRGDATEFPGVTCRGLTPKLLVKHLRDFVVVDVETTGLRADRDEIIEVCALRFVDFKPVNAFSTLVNPGRHIPDSASDIHGIYDDDVEDAPCMQEIVEAMDAFIGNSPIVAHNLTFDLRFLYKDYDMLQPKRLYFDTLSLSRQHVRARSGDRLVNYKLGTVFEHFGYCRDDEHRSLSDAYATGLIFIRIAQLIAGVDSPDALLARKHLCEDVTA